MLYLLQISLPAEVCEALSEVALVAGPSPGGGPRRAEMGRKLLRCVSAQT